MQIDITVDLETTANGPNNSPEAHWPQNRVLLWGHKMGSAPVWVDNDGLRLIADIRGAYGNGYQIRIIGHNLKFDLKYMMRKWPTIPWHKFDYVCTMHRAYRLSGHRAKFISLEDTAKVHSIPFKKTLDLGALIKSGIKMENIPRSDLEPYLRDDVQTTHKIAMEQDLEDKDLLSSLVLPLAHMELLGLPLDHGKATILMRKLAKRERELECDMFAMAEERLKWSDGIAIVADDIKLNAPRTVSYLLTGTPVSGLTKGKKAIIFKSTHCPDLTLQDVAKYWNVQPGHLGYPIPAKKLQEIFSDNPKLKYIEYVLEYRKIQKLMGTYVGPFLEKTKTIATIHPKMNVAATATGRLSSSDPNGQNMPPEARELIKSEFGQFHEIDFKQLEVAALAAISQCPQLIADLRAGVDVHFQSGKRVMGWKTESNMTKDQRRVVKAVNFGLIYGAGVNGLSLSTGQPKKIIKDLINGFYGRYTGVPIWQEEFYREVTRALKPADIKDGEQRYKSIVTLPISNRRFFFIESESPRWLRGKTGRKWSFKPTETKNYPVQGFAGGDIVMLALVLLHERLWDEYNTEIRMTVHDSILVDTEMTAENLESMMNLICREIEAVFALPFELGIDITSGPYWR